MWRVVLVVRELLSSPSLWVDPFVAALAHSVSCMVDAKLRMPIRFSHPCGKFNSAFLRPPMGIYSRPGYHDVLLNETAFVNQQRNKAASLRAELRKSLTGGLVAHFYEHPVESCLNVRHVAV